MQLCFRNDWTHNMEYRIRLHNRTDFAAFYHTFLLQAYAPLRISAGESVLDAGAYIGVWTTLASFFAGPTGRVVAVEPDRGNFERLRHHLQINKATNVHPVRKALWSRPDVAVRLEGQTDEVKISERGDQEAVTATIDSLARFHEGPFDRIKMSITGAEVEALKGAETSIPRCRQIVLEVYGSSNLAFVRSMLREHGFQVHTARFESLHRALREFARHPFLTSLVEGRNHFRTALRLAEHLTGQADYPGDPKAEYWLVQAAR